MINMKRSLLIALPALLVLSYFAGCSKPESSPKMDGAMMKSDSMMNDDKMMKDDKMMADDKMMKDASK